MERLALVFALVPFSGGCTSVDGEAPRFFEPVGLPSLLTACDVGFESVEMVVSSADTGRTWVGITALDNRELQPCVQSASGLPDVSAEVGEQADAGSPRTSAFVSWTDDGGLSIRAPLRLPLPASMEDVWTVKLAAAGEEALAVVGARESGSATMIAFLSSDRGESWRSDVVDLSSVGMYVRDAFVPFFADGELGVAAHGFVEELHPITQTMAQRRVVWVATESNGWTPTVRFDSQDFNVVNSPVYFRPTPLPVVVLAARSGQSSMPGLFVGDLLGSGGPQAVAGGLTALDDGDGRVLRALGSMPDDGLVLVLGGSDLALRTWLEVADVDQPEVSTVWDEASPAAHCGPERLKLGPADSGYWAVCQETHAPDWPTPTFRAHHGGGGAIEEVASWAPASATPDPAPSWEFTPFRAVKVGPSIQTLEYPGPKFAVHSFSE